MTSATSAVVYQFEDLQPSALPFCSYSHALGSKPVPIVIDNGSHTCRAGWAGENAPRLQFRNLQLRTKPPGGAEATVLVGGDIGNLEAQKANIKTQFDQDVVVHMELQENVLDSIFQHLSVSSEACVPHPVLMTEALCNPGVCRSGMSELLFEGYGVPSVSYAVDSLLSLHKNLTAVQDALVVSSSYTVTTVIPYLNGRPVVSRAKRINIGGLHLTMYMQRLLQLKYPVHTNSITFLRAQELVQRFCAIAQDYRKQSTMWLDGESSFPGTVVLQLPYNANSSFVSMLMRDPEKTKEKRAKMGRTLQELHQRKREEKLSEARGRYQQLIKIKELEYDDEDAFQASLLDMGITSTQDLELELEKLLATISSIETKIEKSLKNPEEELEKLEDTAYVDPRWLASVHQQREVLLERKQQRQIRRMELSSRKSGAARQRMKILSELAKNNDTGAKKKSDTFGADDTDWDVYRYVSKDGDQSDSDKEREELKELESVLAKYDKDFKVEDKPNMGVEDVAAFFQLQLGSERYRVPEALFRPHLIGIDQAGLVEVIECVLSSFSPEEQSRMVQSVVLTGGNAMIPGMKERLQTELLSIRPFQSSFHVHRTEDPLMDAWKGGSSLAASSSDVFFSRQDYAERGADYLKEFALSNKHCRIPDT